MSTDNNKMVLAGALLVGAYLYSRRGVAAGTYVPSKNPYAVGSMPGSAGVGWEQVGVSALTGFLKGLASGVRNGADSYTPSLYNPSQATTDWSQSGTVQDVFSPADDSQFWA